MASCISRAEAAQADDETDLVCLSQSAVCCIRLHDLALHSLDFLWLPRFRNTFFDCPCPLSGGLIKHAPRGSIQAAVNGTPPQTPPPSPYRCAAVKRPDGGWSIFLVNHTG